jgi:hypothetical protein
MKPVLRLRQWHNANAVNDLLLVMPGNKHHVVAGLGQALGRPVKDPAVKGNMNGGQHADLGGAVLG